MRTGNAVIIVVAMVLLVFVGIVVAEDVMMPQELEEKPTVSNSSNNTNDSVDVKRHIPPRGVMQKAILVFWDPFGNAPIENGFKVYNGALWYPYIDGSWIQVAFINNNNQVTQIQVWNETIVNNIKDNYQTADNVTVTMVEEPTSYNLEQAETTDSTASSNDTISNDTDTNNGNEPGKINTAINLNSQKLSQDTSATVTGTLVDENGAGIADAEVTITVNGQSYTQTTDSSGQFSYEYNANSGDLSVGSNTMKVSYSGNETYSSASKTITITLEGTEEIEETTDDNIEDTTDDKVEKTPTKVEPTKTEQTKKSSSSTSKQKSEKATKSPSSSNKEKKQTTKKSNST
ncbi:MAG: carboxypeptidase regulatory-like domain-containing protein [Methanosphaera sp.]|nr:carboxypeptidase regulatory-like domain-containing protein [Methanosphaera sp.]